MVFIFIKAGIGNNLLMYVYLFCVIRGNLFFGLRLILIFFILLRPFYKCLWVPIGGSGRMVHNIYVQSCENSLKSTYVTDFVFSYFLK